MTWVETLIASFGIKKAALIAGIIGGWLSLRFFEDQTLGGKWMTVIGGAASANYLTSPILGFFNLGAGSYEGGVGFAIGLFGMSLAAAIMKFIKEDLNNFIRNKIGGSK